LINETNMFREMALNTTSGAQMALYARVKQLTGTNFVIRRFYSCVLRTETSSSPPW
jgi:hypothetical protein